MNKQLKEKTREALTSVLPITAIVLVLSLTLAPMPVSSLMLFLVGALLLIIGVGLFNIGVDIAMMVHGSAAGPDEAFDFSGGLGMNGCMAKTIRYKGKSAHAGGAPHLGINAQYAAMLGLQACNDLRETFQEKGYHPLPSHYDGRQLRCKHHSR